MSICAIIKLLLSRYFCSNGSDVLHSSVGNALDSSFWPNYRDGVVAIPGQYQASSLYFQEPRPDLHVKYLRLLPTIRRIVGQSDLVHYRIQLVGENGVIYPFDIQLTNMQTSNLSDYLQPTIATEVSPCLPVDNLWIFVFMYCDCFCFRMLLVSCVGRLSGDSCRTSMATLAIFQYLILFRCVSASCFQ